MTARSTRKRQCRKRFDREFVMADVMGSLKSGFGAKTADVSLLCYRQSLFHVTWIWESSISTDQLSERLTNRHGINWELRVLRALELRA